MPIWPIYVLAVCAILYFGQGRDELTQYTKTLALIAAGVIAMRYTNLAENTPALHMFGDEVERVGFYSFLVWCAVTFLVAYNSNFLVAFLLGVSTIAYIPWVVANVGITHLGIAAIASDIPLILAILACGNGAFGNPIGSHTIGLRNFVSGLSTGADMAKGQARVSQDVRED